MTPKMVTNAKVLSGQSLDLDDASNQLIGGLDFRAAQNPTLKVVRLRDDVDESFLIGAAEKILGLA